MFKNTNPINNDASEQSPLLPTAPKSGFSIRGVLSRGFMKWGTGVMHVGPWGMKALVLLPLLVAVGITMGAIILNREERPEKLWLLEDDWVLQDRLYRQTTFERATEEALLIVAKAPDGDVLANNKAILDEVYALHNKVMALSVTVTDPSGRKVVVDTPSLCLQSNATFQCYVTAVFAFWNYNQTIMDMDRDPHATLTANWKFATDPITGGPLFPEQVVGGVEYDASGTVITKAKALKLWYYLNNNFTVNNAWPNWESDVLGAWEDAFLDLASQEFEHIVVYRHAAKSDGAVMADAMNNDLPYVVAALLAVIFAVVFYILMSPALLHDGNSPRFGERALRSFVAVVCAGLSMSSTMGFIGLTGLPFSGVTWYMIFYVLVHQCHAMALLVNALDVLTVAMPTQGRLGAALGAVGPTMLTTSLPIVVMFASLSLAPVALPCVRTLAVAGSFGLFMNLILVFTTFTGTLARSMRRLQREGYVAEEPPCVGLRSITSFYQWAVSSWLFKSVVVLCILGMVGDSVNGFISWKQTADEASVYPTDSYLHQFYVQDNDYFGNLRIPVDVVLHETDYSKPENAQAMLQLANNMLASEYTYVYPGLNYSLHYSWYNGLLTFANAYGFPVIDGAIPAEMLFPAMQAWLYTSMSPGAKNFSVIFEFYVDMLFKNVDGSVSNFPFYPPPPVAFTNTRFQGFSIPLTDVQSQTGAVEALHAITSNAPGGLNVSLYAPPFYIFRTFTTVRQWTNYIIIATSVSSAVSVFLTLCPLPGLLVLLSLASVSLDTIGLFMHSIGYCFDSSTLPMIMFMIPLATELLVHFASFSRVPLRLSVMPAGEHGSKAAKPLAINAATASLAYGPATATLICGILGTLLGLLVMMAGVTSPVLYVFGALSAVIVGLAGAHVLVLPAFLPGF